MFVDMREYKVEFTEVKKYYASVTVEASSKKDAIAKVRSAGLDLDSMDDHETVGQTEWTASTEKPGFMTLWRSLWT
mgnify:CR=1 FL=1